MKVNTNTKPVKFHGLEDQQIMLRSSNMGEPYRDGVDFAIDSGGEYFGAFLEIDELKRMRDFLNDYLNDKS